MAIEFWLSLSSVITPPYDHCYRAVTMCFVWLRCGTVGSNTLNRWAPNAQRNRPLRDRCNLPCGCRKTQHLQPDTTECWEGWSEPATIGLVSHQFLATAFVDSRGLVLSPPRQNATTTYIKWHSSSNHLTKEVRPPIRDAKTILRMGCSNSDANPKIRILNWQTNCTERAKKWWFVLVNIYQE